MFSKQIIHVRYVTISKGILKQHNLYLSKLWNYYNIMSEKKTIIKLFKESYVTCEISLIASFHDGFYIKYIENLKMRDR